MSRYDVDLLVLGGGAAGLTAAGTAANLGAKTMMVERHRPGGDCTWTGCVPSKTLLHAASLRAKAQDYIDRFAPGAELPPVDFDAVMADVHNIRQEVYHDADRPEIFEGFGIEVVSADARFTGPHSARLETPDGGRDVTFRMAVIATGGRAAPPPISGLDETPHLTNEGLFEITELPEHLIIVGGGPIGCEMGQAFRRLGSQVTILDRADHLLGKDDPDHADMLQGVLEAEGVDVRLAASVDKVSGTEGEITVTVTASGETSEITGDRLLIATGRKPNIENLGLDDAGIAWTKRGVTVDDGCKTSVGHIWGAGDCTGEYALTHMSEHMGKQAATNAILKIPAPIDRDGITWTTYTTPEVAQLGPTENELEEAGTSFVVYRFPFTKVDRAITEHAEVGQIKILATEWRGKILGASAVGERAGEMISMLAVAMNGGVSVKTLSETIIPYPTYGLAVRRAADQYYVQKQFPLAIDAIKRVFGYTGTTPPAPDPDRVL